MERPYLTNYLFLGLVLTCSAWFGSTHVQGVLGDPAFYAWIGISLLFIPALAGVWYVHARAWDRNEDTRRGR